MWSCNWLFPSCSARQAVDYQHPTEPAQVRQPLCGRLLLQHVPGIQLIATRDHYLELTTDCYFTSTRQFQCHTQNVEVNLIFDLLGSKGEGGGEGRKGRRPTSPQWQPHWNTWILHSYPGNQSFPLFNIAALHVNLSWNDSSFLSFQFENSLGKLQVVTVKAPRQIIDVGVVSSLTSDNHGTCSVASS